MKLFGGYFEFENYSKLQSFNGYYVNSGRSGFELILNQIKPEKIYVPYFICDCIFHLLDEMNQNYECYHVDENLEIINLDKLLESKYPILYVNYFGIKDEYCDKLKSLLKDRLILDLTQGLFYQIANYNGNDAYSFSSLRKFMGVPDGGFLMGIDEDDIDDLHLKRYDATENIKPLILRKNGEVSKGYEQFKATENLFETEHPMKMSFITEFMMNEISFEDIRKIRLQNFNFLFEEFRQANQLRFKNDSAALCFPLLIENGCSIKKKFIENKIFVPTYWPNLLNLNNNESRFVQDLLCLPIDQRYDLEDMKHISNVLRSFI